MAPGAMATSTLPSQVGFIGLGLMGLPMARNLAQKLPLNAGLYIYDISEKAMQSLETGEDTQRYMANIIRCSSPSDVASRAIAILTMLPEGSHVREVYLNEEHGILKGLPTDHDTLLIDMSTIDTATSSAVASNLTQSHPKAKFHDAPVSGGVLGAQKASLTFMLGIASSAPHYTQIEALLQTMGANLFACGGPTLGLVAKLCNNYCSGLIAIATSEAFSIAISQGMDPRVLKEVFSKSLAQSCINDKWNPVPGLCPDAPASKGYDGGFRVGLMRKDFGLAKALGEENGVKTRLAEEGYRVYQEAEKDPQCEGKDSRVVYRYLGGDEDWMEKLHNGQQ